MPSETDLLNESLSQIGAARISAIDDGSINANYCQMLYPALLDSILRMHHWNFATGRVVLEADATAPLFEFTYSYPLPQDFLKIREYNGADTSVDTTWWWDGRRVQRYVIEGRALLSNEAEVKIVYTKRITDPNIWDALFYQVVVTWLAGKLANAIPKDTKKSASLIQEAVSLLLPMAVGVDGQEGTVIPFQVDDLTWGR